MDISEFHALFLSGSTQELEDYFYYSQIRTQGIDTMETRQVSEHICLSELPFVMRAIGFYPSEEKVGRTHTQDQHWDGLFISSISGNSHCRPAWKHAIFLK